MKSAEKTKKMHSGVGYTILNILLWGVVIIAAFFSVVTFATKSSSTNKVANILGYTPMPVLSDSMNPTFKKGDLIIIKKTDPETLAVNDVVTFFTLIDGERVANTHRIVEVIGERPNVEFKTQGDNTPGEDRMPVKKGDIIGKYIFAIPMLGTVISFLGNSWGFMFVIVIPLLIFFIFQVYKLILLLIEMKKETVKEANEQSRDEIEAELRKKIEAEMAQSKTEKTENKQD